MRKYRRIILLWISIYSGIVFTACGQKEADGDNRQIVENAQGQEKPETEPEQDKESKRQEEIKEDTQEDIRTAEKRAKQNEEKFYETTKALELERAEAVKYYERICKDNVFRDGTGKLTALWIGDLDENGQKDMLVMVQEGDYFYGDGCIYFYMNEDEAYRFEDDKYPFGFNLDVVTGDFDNDGNTEIVFESHGTGCGAAGDWSLRILKYKDHTMERMDFPSETYEDDERSVRIDITQESQANTYSAYCAYLDETIEFEAENIFEPGNPRIVGHNVRGYYNICSAEYEGRDALVVSEYLCGEGGNVHYVGKAKFLILWEKDGSSRIVKWWIDP